MRFYTKNDRFAFSSSPLALRLIEKRVVDFLLVLLELFSLGVTAEALRANIGSKIGDFAPTGAG